MHSLCVTSVLCINEDIRGIPQQDLLELAAPELDADAEELSEDARVEHVIPTKDKLRIVQSTIHLLDISRPKHAALHRSLRKFQQEIQTEGKTEPVNFG